MNDNDFQKQVVTSAMHRMYSGDLRRYLSDIRDLAETMRPAGQPGGQPGDTEMMNVLQEHMRKCRQRLGEYLTTGAAAPLLALLNGRCAVALWSDDNLTEERMRAMMQRHQEELEDEEDRRHSDELEDANPF